MLTADEATRLAAWRLEIGYTLAELSDLTGFSTAMLSRAERGQRVFSPAAKVRIARRLGVSVSDLFEVEPLSEVEVRQADPT
jgi:transcriptional regulator with XRE-family HTH domain